MALVMSAITGMAILPRPPLERGVWIHARCENLESTDAAATFTPMASNSFTRSLNWMISARHGGDADAGADSGEHGSLRTAPGGVAGKHARAHPWGTRR